MTELQREQLKKFLEDRDLWEAFLQDFRDHNHGSEARRYPKGTGWEGILSLEAGRPIDNAIDWFDAEHEGSGIEWKKYNNLWRDLYHKGKLPITEEMMPERIRVV